MSNLYEEDYIDEELDKPRKFDLGLVKYIAIAIIIVIVALVIYFNLPGLGNTFDSGPLQINFAKNPVQAGESTLMSVKLINNSEFDLNNLVVEAAAIDSASINVFPSVQNVSILEKQTEKSLEYSVQPKNGILKGSYAIELKTVFNGKAIVKRVFIKVE